MFVPPKNDKKNNIPADAGHFLSTEIEETDFKDEHLTTKIKKTRQKNYIFLTKYSKRS